MTAALITCGHLQRHFERYRPELEAAGIEPRVPKLNGQQFSAEEMRQHIQGCAAVIAGDDVIDRSVLEAGLAGGLKVVIKWGIGTDSIDKAAAAALGVPVYNTPGAFGEEVGDLALAFLLLLSRKLHLMHQSVLDGGWLKVEGRSLLGLTAGIVGLGSIGRAIATRVRGFGMNAIGFDPVPIDPGLLARCGARQVSLEEVLTRSNAIFIACNLTPENRHMFNRDALQRMLPGAWLVNISRGPIVDEAALAEVLTSGHLAGAGLDVFEDEPLPAASPLRKFDNCVFGTHNGSNTRESVERVNQLTVSLMLHLLGIRSDPKLQPNRVA